MTRRLLALALALTMALALAACGGNSGNTAGSDTDANTGANTAENSGTSDSSDSGSAIQGVEDGVLTVGMECTYAPYNWTQTDDANGAVQIRDSSDYAYGYDVMMAKKIAEALGQEVQIVKLDWDSLVPAVMSGDVDCVIAGQSITSERAQQVDFSDPYYYASIVTLVKKDSPYASATSVADLAGAT